MFRWEWGVVRVALEMVSTFSRHVRQWCFLTLSSNREVIRPSNYFLVREADHQMWSRRRSVVWINEDHSFNRPKGGLGPGPRYGMGHIIGLKPEARMGLDFARLYNSPPLIRAQFSRTNQRIQGVMVAREVQWVDIGRLRNPLMRPQKVRCIWLFAQLSSIFDSLWTEVACVVVNGDLLAFSPPPPPKKNYYCHLFSFWLL